MNLAPVDLALLGGAALVVGIGLYRGLSGELASLAGFVAAVLAGYSLYGYAHVAVRAFGCNKGDATELVVTGVVTFFLGLIAFGIVQRVINKFVSFLVPQPTNAILGGVSGLFKCAVCLFLLAGVGFLRPGTYAQGGLSVQSRVVRTFAEWADTYFSSHPAVNLEIGG